MFIGNQRIIVEVASTEHELEQGLMHRKKLDENAGMLFVFPPNENYCMWMKDTAMALSVAFMDSAGYVVNTAAMRPNSLDLHCPARPVRYGLEMKGSWFANHNVDVGSKVIGLDAWP